MKYALMLKPNSNIPYFEESKRLCLVELEMVLKTIKYTVSNIEVVNYGKAYYVVFETENIIEEKKYKHFRQLSFYYTLFQVEGEWFKPIASIEEQAFGDDLSVRLKYSGKTNEGFTKLLINTALYSSNYFNERRVKLLDPVCGKGTTLYEGLISGFDVYGAELNKKSVEELKTYFVRYLKEGRYKHSIVEGKAKINSKSLGETLEIKASKSKEAFKANQAQTLKVFRGDTSMSHRVFPKNSMHIIVGDLPYGIAHMGKTETEQKRNLFKLLNRSFEVWYGLLKKGGALSLAWNTYTNTRDELKELLESKGYEVLSDDGYLNFEHRVSQAINRDIIVAVKK